MCLYIFSKNFIKQICFTNCNHYHEYIQRDHSVQLIKFFFFCSLVLKHAISSGKNAVTKKLFTFYAAEKKTNFDHFNLKFTSKFVCPMFSLFFCFKILFTCLLSANYLILLILYV